MQEMRITFSLTEYIKRIFLAHQYYNQCYSAQDFIVIFISPLQDTVLSRLQPIKLSYRVHFQTRYNIISTVSLGSLS
jgi:hypothetical protein